MRQNIYLKAKSLQLLWFTRNLHQTDRGNIDRQSFKINMDSVTSSSSAVAQRNTNIPLLQHREQSINSDFINQPNDVSPAKQGLLGTMQKSISQRVDCAHSNNGNRISVYTKHVAIFYMLLTEQQRSAVEDGRVCEGGRGCSCGAVLMKCKQTSKECWL